MVVAWPPPWWPPLIGTLLGALSGFFGGKLGDLLEWVYNVFTAIPTILLFFTFAVIFGRAASPRSC